MSGYDFGDAKGAPRRLRVFLCHASGDKTAVRTLYQRLQAAGVAPWLDEEDLLPGQNWEYEIRKAIRAIDIVIVCLSQGSITKTGFVQKEITFALDVAEEQPEEKIYLIPLKLELCALPERLSHLHAVNYYEERGFATLLRALHYQSTLLGIPSTVLKERVQPTPSVSPQTWTLLHTLKGHTNPVLAVAISPDGATVVSASYDSTLKVWELASGRLLHTLRGHTNLVYAVAISPDGTTIVSGSYDSTLKVWELANGRLLHTLKGHTNPVLANPVLAVAISPDGTTIVSGSRDSTLKVWGMK